MSYLETTQVYERERKALLQQNAELAEALRELLGAIEYASDCMDHFDCLPDYGKRWGNANQNAKTLLARIDAQEAPK